MHILLVHPNLRIPARGQLIFARTNIRTKVVVWRSSSKEIKMRWIGLTVGAGVLVGEPFLQVGHVEGSALCHGEAVARTGGSDGTVLRTYAAGKS